ncbi:hypothetical protein J4459_02900 [Candidatus Woesearchaeota archaeon]|nr:hypothetical protein [Candidatus Woesearchaeota archaeon]
MPIVGFNFTEIGSKKQSKFLPNKKVKSDLKLTGLEKEKLPIGESDDVLKFLFNFKIEYEDCGEINLLGHVLYLDDLKKIDEILKKWEGKKNMPVDLMDTILNAILFRCHIKALMLSQDVNLPPHFKMPRVVPKVEN